MSMKMFLAAAAAALAATGAFGETSGDVRDDVVEEEYRQAFELAEEAVASGMWQAEFYIAVAYQYGMGVEKDEDAAFEIFSRLALNGLPEAQYMLGLLYLDGAKMPEDLDDAAKWLTIAAENGHPRAASFLPRVEEKRKWLDDEANRETAPEPSAAMLFLAGAAMMALRRRTPGSGVGDV